LVIREGTNTQQFLVNLSISDSNLKDATRPVWETLLETLKQDAFLKEKVNSFVITYNNGLADTVRNNESQTSVVW
jgi:hypothetical protein